MTIAILGKHGFVGKNLTSFLEKQGENVLQSDVDVLDPTQLGVLFAQKPQIVINLAAYGNDSTHDQQSPEGIDRTIRTNIPIELLSQFIRSESKVFIQAGSSSEYGKHDVPLSVDLPLNGETPYAKSKAAFSTLLKGMDVDGKTFRTLRLFSVYGEGEAPHRFIPTALRAARDGETIPLSKGSHDFVHIDDVCRAFYRIILDARSTPLISHAASGVQYSNLEVIEYIEKITGKHIHTYPEILRSFDTSFWVSNTKDILVSPELSLEEGLRKTWQSLLKNS